MVAFQLKKDELLLLTAIYVTKTCYDKGLNCLTSEIVKNAIEMKMSHTLMEETASSKALTECIGPLQSGEKL